MYPIPATQGDDPILVTCYLLIFVVGKLFAFIEIFSLFFLLFFLLSILLPYLCLILFIYSLLILLILFYFIVCVCVCVFVGITSDGSKAVNQAVILKLFVASRHGRA